MEVANILENKERGLIYGLMGNINLTTNHVSISIITSYKFPGTTKEYLNSEKALSSLKMVLLDESILFKTSSECSISELKRISLAKALIENKECIVLNYFEQELNYQERRYFKSLSERLSENYHKTIVIFTNDITSFWNIASSLLIVDKYKVINTIKKEDYFKFMDNLNKPEIVRITELIQEKGIPIENYQDGSDLLKAIYRIKEQRLKIKT